jgi:formylglycine-generating enzyme required for sulfatase activity
LLVDACRNELDDGEKSIDTDYLPRPARGTAALFSCSSGEKSHETAKLGKGHGVFFYHVLQGLKGEAANKRREVTWDRLVAYVKEEVPTAVTRVIREGAQQSPELIGRITNAPVLVRGSRPDAGERKLELADKVTNSIGMKLKLIPKGKFRMGSPRFEANRGANEGPRHQVQISKPFYMGVYEVTQAQYQKVMGTNPSFFSETGGGSDKVADLSTDTFPVETVSWHEAVEFCKKLSALPQEKKAGREYRLPSEAEWEYACRAKTTTPFHFGEKLSSRMANFDGTSPYGGAAKGPNLERTCKVGSYAPNAWGLYDMHGNVREWTADWYKKDYYAVSPPLDPKGPRRGVIVVYDRDGDRPLRGVTQAMRGGSWLAYGWACRAAMRNYYPPGNRYMDVGFRVACVATPEAR